MSLMLEPNPTQIKEERIYAGNGANRRRVRHG